MEDQKPDGFKIDFSDDIPEPPGKGSDPLPGKKPKKKAPSKARPSFIFALIFCLFAGILFLVYYHLNSRIAQMETARRQQAQSIVESVSDNIEKRFSAISAIVSEPTKQIKARILELEKQVKEQKSGTAMLEKEIADTKASIQTSLSEAEKKLLNKISLQDNKINAIESKLESSADQYSEKINTIEKQVANLQQLSSSIEKAKKKTELLENQIRAVEQKTETLRSDIKNMATRKNIEEKTAQTEAMLVKKIDEDSSKMHKKIIDMQDQISALEAIIRSLQNIPARSTEESGNGSPGNSEDPGQGQIIEQELQ
jgi:chromosome segregation ATPase